MKKLIFLIITLLTLFISGKAQINAARNTIIGGAAQKNLVYDLLLVQSSTGAPGSGGHWYRIDDRDANLGVFELISRCDNQNYCMMSLYEASASTGIIFSPDYWNQGDIVQDADIFWVNFGLTGTAPNPGAINSDKNSACYGSNVTLTVYPSGGNGTFSYYWYECTDGFTWHEMYENTQSIPSNSIFGTTKYRCRVESGGLSKTTDEKIITCIGTAILSAGNIGVNGTATTTQNICYNTAPSNLTTRVAASGGSSSYTYQWQSSTDNVNYTNISGATGSSYQPGVLTQTTYFHKLVIDATCGTKWTNYVLITVNPDVLAGSITANQTICYNTAPALLNTSVAPTGGNGTYIYQWQSSLDNSSFSDISGATGTTYQPGALTQTTYYRKTVINTCKTVYTPSVTITVLGNLSGGTIASTQTICYNTAPSQIATTVNATGGVGSYTYAWESSPDNSIWSTISGATLVAYQPAAITQTTYYRKKTTDSSCGFAYSNTVTVNVRPNFSVGVIGNSQTICYNTAPALLDNTTAPSGGANSFTYQWESSTDNVNFFIISGQIVATYQAGALTQTTYYRRKVTDASCGNGYTNTVTITVKPNFSIGTIGTNQTVCYNSAPTLIDNVIAPSGGMGSYSYFWEYSINGTDWSIISSANGASYQPGALTQTTYYRRKVTDSSCGNGYNTPVTITVRPIFSAGSISSDQNICYNSAPSLLITLVSPSGGTGSFTNSWESSLDGSSWDIITGATGSTYQPPVLTVKTYYRKKVVDACGSGYTAPITISIRQDVNFGSIGSTQTVCYNSAPTLLSTDVAPSGGMNSFSYQWESSPNGTSAWSTIIGASGEGYLPGNLTATTYYRRKVTDVCKSGYTNTINVTVRPNLSAGSILDNQTVCFNATPALLATSTFPTGGTGSYTFQWERSINNINWTTIPGATNEVYQPAALSSSTYFHRLETSGTCGTVSTNSVIVTVNGQLIAGTVKSDQTICYGSAPSIFLTNAYPTGGIGTYTYQWQKLIGSSWTDINGATSETYSSPALATNSYFRRAETSGTCGTVYSNQITVTVYPQFLAGVISSSQTVNYNAAPSEFVSIQDASGGTGEYTYQWKNSVDNSFWSTITGATAVSYQAPALIAKTYYKRETTSGTCGTLQTNVLTISVNAQLAAGEISSSQTICNGATPNQLNTSIASTGGNGAYVYQWQKTEDGSSWSDITGANSESYQPGTLAKTTYFRKKVTSVSTDAFTNIVTITVYDVFAAGVIGADQTVCYSSVPNPLNPVSLPSGGNGTFTNQWKTSLNGSAWTDISGATESFYEPSSLTTKTYFKKVVTNLCGVKETNTVTVNVNPIFTPGSIGSNQTILFNSTPLKLDVSTTPSGGTGSYSYQWQSSLDNSIWTNIGSATLESYQPGSIAQTTYFKRLTTSGTCGTIATNTVTITVTTEVLVGTIGNDQTVCYNASPNLLTTLIQPSQGVVINSQVWQKSEDGTTWSDILAATSDSYQPGSLTVKTYYRKKMVTASSGTINTNIITITVNPAFTSGTIGVDQSVCKTYPSVPITTLIQPVGQSIVNQWQSSDNNVSWTDIASATQDFYDAGVLTVTKYFRKRVTSSCGSGNTQSVKITVNDELLPGSIGSDQSISNGTAPSLLVGMLPTGGDGIYTYQWYYSTNSTQWNVAITNGNGRDYQPGSLTQLTYFKRSVTSNACGTKESNVVTISVFETLTPGMIADGQSICFSTSPTLLTGSSPTGGTGQYSYQWLSSPDGTTWANIANEQGVSYQPGNLTQNTYFKRSVSSGNSVVYSNYILVRIYDQIAQPVTSIKTSYCKNAKVNLDVVNPAYLSYKWYDASRNYLLDGTRYTVDNLTGDVTVYVKSVSTNGCYSDLLEQNISMDNLRASFTHDISQVNIGNAVRFTSTSVNANSFVWNFFDGDLIFEQNPTHYYNTTDGLNEKRFDVKLKALSTNGCKDSILVANAVTVVNITGINTDRVETPTYFPNPVTENLTVHSNTRIVAVRVLSIIGNVIDEYTFNSESVTIPFNAKSSGVYIIQITDAKGVKSNIKVMKP